MAKQAIDRGITPGDFGQVELWVAVFVAVAIAGWLFGAVQSYLTTWVGERVLTDLRSDLFAHVQQLDLGYFERTRAGVVISRLTNDIEALNTLVTDGPTTLVQNTITLIGSALVLLYLDWRLALATLVVFPGMAIATGIYRHYSARAYRLHARAAGRGHRQPAGGHLGRARGAGVPARGRQLPPVRGRQRLLPRRQRADGERERDLLPVRRPAVGDRRWRSCSATAACWC